jgi:hypothetical protein
MFPSEFIGDVDGADQCCVLGQDELGPLALKGVIETGTMTSVIGGKWVSSEHLALVRRRKKGL